MRSNNMKHKQILEQAIKVVTGQRHKDYGDKYINHKNIADLWSDYLDVKITPHDAAICMLLVKIARLKNRHIEDNYVDIAGYAAVAGEINERTESGTST